MATTRRPPPQLCSTAVRTSLHGTLVRVVDKVGAQHHAQRPLPDHRPKPDDLCQQCGVEREPKAKPGEEQRVRPRELDGREKADRAASTREGGGQRGVAARLTPSPVLRELRQERARVQDRRRCLREVNRGGRRFGERPHTRGDEGNCGERKGGVDFALVGADHGKNQGRLGGDDECLEIGRDGVAVRKGVDVGARVRRELEPPCGEREAGGVAASEDPEDDGSVQSQRASADDVAERAGKRLGIEGGSDVDHACPLCPRRSPLPREVDTRCRLQRMRRERHTREQCPKEETATQKTMRTRTARAIATTSPTLP
eukprot:3999834-Prymnesium_polylepis.1